MADYLVFRKTGEREDGAPILEGPIGPIVRGKKADDPESAVLEVGAAGEDVIVFRYDTSVELAPDGPPPLKRTRG